MLGGRLVADLGEEWSDFWDLYHLLERWLFSVIWALTAALQWTSEIFICNRSKNYYQNRDPCKQVYFLCKSVIKSKTLRCTFGQVCKKRICWFWKSWMVFSRSQLHRFSACSRGNIARKNKEAYYLYAALKPRSSQASKT